MDNRVLLLKEAVKHGADRRTIEDAIRVIKCKDIKEKELIYTTMRDLLNSGIHDSDYALVMHSLANYIQDYHALLHLVKGYVVGSYYRIYMSKTGNIEYSIDMADQRGERWQKTILELMF